MIVEFTLAGAPVGKGRPRFVKATGRAFTPEKTVRFEDRLSIVAQDAMVGKALLTGPLQVIVEVNMPIPVSKPKKWQAAALAGQIRPLTKPDADNFAKMLDACNLVVWTDDAQIVDLRVLKFYSATPRLTVRASEINNEEGIFG